jgi:PAS domain S-box-containing protein
MRTGCSRAGAVKLDAARKRGYEGLRVTGNTFWLEEENWEDYTHYEAKVNDVIGSTRMLALCTFSLEKCGPREILDVVASHEFALLREGGRWELLKNIARRKAERTLKESRGDLERAQAVAHIGSWQLDVNRGELTWSAETFRMLGIRPGTPLTYKGFLPAIHPDDRECVDRHWQAALKGAPYDIEHRIVVNNETKWVRERAELEFNEEGKLLGGCGTVQDITDKKQSEQALRESEERYRQLVEQMNDGIFVVGSDRRYVDVNPAGCAMLGMSREEILASARP